MYLILRNMNKKCSKIQNVYLVWSLTVSSLIAHEPVSIIIVKNTIKANAYSILKLQIFECTYRTNISLSQYFENIVNSRFHFRNKRSFGSEK